MIILFTLNVSGQSSDVKKLLENRDTREEIYNTILNDHNFMMEFMGKMRGSEHAMAMMRGNHDMMMNLEEGTYMQGSNMGPDNGRMMDTIYHNPELMQEMMGHMMDMCETDSSVCTELTDMIAEHPGMMQMMMQKFNQEGMMGKNPGHDMTNMPQHKNMMH